MSEQGVEVSVTVKNLKEIQKKMDQVVRDLSGDPMKGAMAKATLLVVRSARKNAPVDRGILRASIVPKIVTTAKSVQGIVGSNKTYAPHQEFGTRPFTPPRAPLWRWALRKSKGNKAAASVLFGRAMGSIRRRGIKAKRYLERALKDNADKIRRIIGDAVGKIVRK